MHNDAVMMHKCLNGLSPSYLSDKFCTRSTIHDRQTRYRDTRGEGSTSTFRNRISCPDDAGHRDVTSCETREVRMFDKL